MGAQARGDEPRGFGKRGAVRLPQARRPAAADATMGAAGEQVASHDAPAHPSDFDMPSRSTRTSLIRQGAIAAGLLLIGLPIVSSLLSGLFRDNPGEQGGASGGSSARAPLIVPVGAGLGRPSQQTVSRGGFGTSGAQFSSGG